MFESTKVFEFFPTLVWEHQLEQAVFDPLNATVMAKLDSLRSQPLGTGAFAQTPPKLHRLPEFAGLVEPISFAVQGILDHLAIVYDAFEITGCWANFAGPDAPHEPHTHPILTPTTF